MNKKNHSIFILFLIGINLFSIAKAQEVLRPPGVVIDHMSNAKGKYIGSASLCILPNGNYIASHDEFGAKTREYRSGLTHVFSSSDKGITWNKISQIDGQFWSNLFVHKGVLYIMGTNRHHGSVIIRKSNDEGSTWTIPYDNTSGLILEGEYHTAPVPMLIHNGRIWRGVEYATSKSIKWGERYSATMLSAPANADLLNAKNWTRSNHLPFDATYLNGNFKAWLEGNAVVTKKGEVVDILRVHAPGLKDEFSAIVHVDKKGKKIRFNREDFVKMPGASKKFTIRYDEKSDRYYSLVNYVKEDFKEFDTDKVRNTVALVSSKDLVNWDVNAVVLSHEDPLYHAFQYIDWLFDGDNIIFASRTAFDDSDGGAKSAHDANYLTFHRIEKFRDK